MNSKREIAVSRMTKGLTALLMALVLVFGFASCDTSTGGDDTLYRTVTYSTEHATAPEKLTVTDGTALTAEQLPALTAEGYTFGGWYDGETKAEAGYKVTKDVTLTAKWTKNTVTPTPDDGEDDGGNTSENTKYTVTFSTNGGTEVASQKIESGKTATEPTAPTKDGYTFGGWFTDSNFTTAFTFSTAIKSDITLYAKWIDASKPTFTVTFSVDGATTTQTVEENAKATKPTDPTKNGYTFTGWYNGDSKFDFDTAITANVTLTAKWTLISYTITYEGLNGVENPNSVTSYTVESETITLQKATKNGYTFVWMKGSEEVTQITKGSTGNITLTGKWTAISYEITYVLPDGVTNPNVTSYTIETDTITLQAVSREGYTFTGWFDAETGGNKVTSIAQGSTGAKTLYAQWWTFSLQVTGTPSKTLYYVGDSLDTTGLTVTATYSDGSSKTVSGWTVSGFSSESVSLGSKLTISYTEGGLTKTADVGFYVAASGAEPTENPVALTDYTGTLAGGTYYAFGDFPQTVSALTGENAYTSEPVYNGWYLGSDGYFYAKCTENACETGYTYSDGTTVAQASANSTKYFKVEPIKWRVLNPSASGNKILLAESILTANIPYYGTGDNRTLNEATVYANNYKYSNIRAYLNGTKNQFVTDGGTATEDDVDWTGKGFLQTAFTNSAQSLIATTTVDNSAASTNPASNASTWDSGTNNYACENTSDKIFLLSEKEATTSDYEFTEYDQDENSRIRATTDYAKANYAYQEATAGYGGWWWLRSPFCWGGDNARYIYDDGAAGAVNGVDCEFYGVVPALCLSSQE